MAGILPVECVRIVHNYLRRNDHFLTNPSVSLKPHEKEIISIFTGRALLFGRLPCKSESAG